ncbi:MAG: hypothetical protein DRJ42_28730 [Deltaproteobacteria bacterium]|nr:MAG: hypothetical protein DRJ42_28730 [Deltaproteobacteria bacterium]
MPDSFFSRMASALGVNGNGDMRMEARSLVNRALKGDEVSRQHLRDLIDGSPEDLEVALREASKDAGMHNRARRSAVRTHAATATATATAPAPATGISPHWESRETYEGDQDVVVMQPLRLYEPETLDDLVFIVKKAEELGHTVKALGAGCSYSGANATSGFLVDMEGLDAMLPIDAAALHPGDHLALRRFQGGARLDQISEHLKQDDLALENMGGLLQLSFVGAATTGTHGSGVRLGNMASQIVSMVVVGSGGTVYRVEPTHGITNPSGWDEPLVDHLKQNDELFHSLRVSVGALGLIYSVTVRTVPLTNLREVRWEMGWQEARERLQNRTDLDHQDMVEIYVNPYRTRDDGDRTALVTIRKSTKKEPVGSGGNRRCLAEMLERFPVAADLAMLYLNLFPGRTPGFIDTALRGLTDAEYIAPRYEVLADSEHSNGFAMELAFSMKDDSYLDHIDEILDLLERHSGEGQQYVNMLSVRFVAASDDYLSMHYDADGHASCTVEFPTLSATTGVRESFRRIQRTMLARGARPHWAMEFGTLTGNGGLLDAMYPELEKWKNAHRLFDATGVFANGFTDRMGFTVPAYSRD